VILYVVVFAGMLADAKPENELDVLHSATNPVSLTELSFHFILILLLVLLELVNPDGAAGTAAMTAKFAVTDLALFMATVTELAVPVASPLHPVNEYPVLAVAVKVTTSPALYTALLGDLVTVPFTTLMVRA